jgi:hypothetical protein
MDFAIVTTTTDWLFGRTPDDRPDLSFYLSFFLSVYLCQVLGFRLSCERWSKKALADDE